MPMAKKFSFYLLLIPILSYFNLNTAKAQFLNYRITTGNSYAVIPFELHNDFIVVPVKLGGMLPLHFILDTGASNTIVIHKEMTDLIGASYQRELFIQGVDRSRLVKVLLTNGVKIELQDVIANNQHLLVLDDNNIEFEKYSGARIDGILGMDIFKRFIVKIDYEMKLIFLFERKSHQYNTSKYTPIPFVHKNSKMYLNSTTDISKTGNIPVKWLIDSGAAMTVLFQCPESDSTVLPTHLIPGNIGKGLGGFIKGYLGNVNQVNFGEFEFKNVIGNFQTIADTLYSPENDSIIEGILGNKILKKFHLIFDYQNKFVYARPNRNFSSKIREDLSGLGIIASGYNLNQFSIEEVYDNSPAALAGLKSGDQIKKINRRNAVLLTLESVEKRLSSQEGKKIKIVIKRGEEKMKFEFYLKDYL